MSLTKEQRAVLSSIRIQAAALDFAINPIVPAQPDRSGLLPASRCANRIYRLGMELDALQSSNLNVEYGYASAMARVLREESFTPESLIEAIGESFIRRTRLMGWLEMSDERSHNSPLHNKVGCSYCESGGANPQPVDSDDPTGAIARIEMLAEMLPSERREFLSRKKES